jgi:hypothetical protein
MPHKTFRLRTMATEPDLMSAGFCAQVEAEKLQSKQQCQGILSPCVYPFPRIRFGQGFSYLARFLKQWNWEGLKENENYSIK